MRKRFKDLKVGQKITLAFVTAIILTTVASFNALSSLKKAGRLSHDSFAGPYQLTNEAMGIRKDLVGVSRRINVGFAKNEHIETRKLILEEFDSLNKRIDKLRNISMNSAGNKKIWEKKSYSEKSSFTTDIDHLEKSVAQLRAEYENIYNLTQTDTFKGSMLEVDLTTYAKIFTDCTDTAIKLYDDAEKNAIEFDTMVSRTVKRAEFTLICLSIFGVVAGVGICLSITTRIKKPIQEIESVANKMADGDFDIDIEYESEDEFGVLANAMLQMSERIKSIINDEVRVLGEISSGNFDVSTDAEYIGVFENIEHSINKITEDLSETMSQINAASEEVEAASEQVAGGSQMLSQGATEQASAIEELSATITEISNKIKETADNASEANVLSVSAGHEVEDGNEQMKQMIKAMEEISFTSNEIGRIIKTIDDIAFQTNILALNAAVEAARAGSAGKGFAVVADEVRNLAAKSAEAAKNTATLIENSIKAVDNGTSIVDNTAKSLQRIIDTTNKTIVLIDEIAQSSEEQASSITHVTLGVEQISEVVQTNSATSEESAAASEELSGQAQMLRGLIENFNLKETYNSNKKSSEKHMNFNVN